MVKKFKTLFAVVLSVALIASSGFCVLAEEDEYYDSYNEYEEYEDSYNEYNVVLNGNYVEFTDAVPVNVEGRIMVPFRAILETLGAQVEWDGETRTVTAVLEDTTIDFTVGQPDINIDKAGEKSVKKMDVVPYIDPANDRTYVSTRFVAESFGFTVGWYAEAKTAVIIDYDSIFGNASEDFTKMDEFMKNTKVDLNSAYESILSAAVEITIYKEIINALNGEDVINKDIDLVIKLDGEALSKGSEASVDMNMTVNTEEFLSALPEEIVGTMDPEDEALFDTISNIEVSAYADVESGEMCFTTNLNPMIYPEAGDNAWFKMDLNDIYGELGMDLETALNMSEAAEITTMAEMFDFIAKSSESSLEVYTYYDMVDLYEIMKALVGDDSLKVSKSGNNTVYTSNMSALGKYMGYDGVKGKLVMTDKQNGNYDCVFDFEMELEDIAEIVITFDVSYNKTDKPVEKVPEGAEVIDISSMITEAL